MSKNNRQSKSRFSPRFEKLEGRDMMTTGLMAAFSPAAVLPATTQPVALVSSSIVNFLSISSRQSAGSQTNVAAPRLWQSQPNWFDTNLHDAAIRSLAETDFTNDRVLTRSDMLAIFSEVESKGAVTATELADLQTIANTPTLFGNLDYVEQLSQDVVDGDAANAQYQGAALGNLAVGSSSLQLTELVDKWFLGTDKPLSNMSGVNSNTYQYAAGTLFGTNGPAMTDVRQGEVGDCYFVAALGEIASRHPNAIKDMFIDNQDGTFTVRFFNNGTPEYVTVDRELPAMQYNGQEAFVFDGFCQPINNSTNVLWAALAEKAYAQLAEKGWSRAEFGEYANSYDAISGGWGFEAEAQITGKQSSYEYMPAGTQTNQMAADFNIMLTALKSGQSVCCGTKYVNDLPGKDYDANGVVGNHEYAVVGYDTHTRTLTLFNPWGVNNGGAPDDVTVTWSKFIADFDMIDIC